MSMAVADFDESDKPPNSYHVNFLDKAILIISIIFHFGDTGVDMYVIYGYYITKKYSYLALTVSFILVSSVIMTLISIRMYWVDKKDGVKKKILLRILVCVFGIPLQLAPVIRYINSFIYAKKCLRAENQGNKKHQEEYFMKMLKENSDAALLKLFECYIESAPQQVLQMTLLLLDYYGGSTVNFTEQTIKLTIGFVSMAICMTSYYMSIRFDQEDKKNISVPGTIVYFFWQFNFTVSRIFSLTALATVYALWMSLGVICHWCLMTIWMLFSAQTNFCGKKLIHEIFFSSAMGCIYIFNYITMKDGPTKKYYIIYYLLCFSENLIAASIWAVRSPAVIKNWIYYIFTILPVLNFILSVVLQLVYYKFLHPNKYNSVVNHVS